MSQHDPMIPSERLLPIMADWLAKPGNTRDGLQRGISAWRLVLARDMVPERVADSLLTALERNDAWYVELADLHERLLEAA